eukprot:scaffold1954_cov268-Pinguiococcus_pyrenoidosus.AAC.24
MIRVGDSARIGRFCPQRIEVAELSSLPIGSHSREERERFCCMRRQEQQFHFDLMLQIPFFKICLSCPSPHSLVMNAGRQSEPLSQNHERFERRFSLLETRDAFDRNELQRFQRVPSRGTTPEGMNYEISYDSNTRIGRSMNIPTFRAHLLLKAATLLAPACIALLEARPSPWGAAGLGHVRKRIPRSDPGPSALELDGSFERFRQTPVTQPRRPHRRTRLSAIRSRT